jgi:putative flippase GtrA
MKDKRVFLRFVIVGSFNTLFGFSIYSASIYLGAGYSLASAIALILGVLFNFKSIGKFVFHADDRNEFIPFFSCYLIVYILTVVGLEILGGMGVNPYLSGVVISVPMAGVSYFLQRRYVFGR